MERLRRQQELHRVLREGERHRAPALVLCALGRPNGPPRAAVLLAQGFGSSVARNRARRLARETARVVLGRIPAPFDLALLVRPQFLDLDFQGRRQLLSDLLRRAGVIPQKVAQPV